MQQPRTFPEFLPLFEDYAQSFSVLQRYGRSGQGLSILSESFAKSLRRVYDSGMSS